jgi:hypothetical protein
MQDEGHWSKTIWIPQLEVSHQVRVDRLGRDLGVEDQAASDGRSNRPPQTDKTLNAPQMNICGKVFGGILLLNQFLAAELGLAVQQARERVARIGDVERLKDRVSHEVDRVFSGMRGRLTDLQVDHMSRKRDLRHFRFDNRLNRSAHYKSSLELTFGILAIMFVGESILNGSLLAEVMVGGLLQGGLLAGLISLINIALGVSAGLFGWRLLGHRRTNLKLIGLAITLTLHTLAVFWNIFVAHFREAAEILATSENFDFELSTLSSATIEHLQVHGLLGMGSIQSWALLLLGLCVHFISAKEGWDDLADRYWDYKRFDRLAVTAADAFDEAVENLRAEARNAVEDIERFATLAAQRAEANALAVAALYDLALQRRQEVTDSEDEWVAAGSQLLKQYRDINLTIRDEGSAPAYFDVYPGAADYRRRAFGGGVELSDEVLEQDKLVGRTLAELDKLKKDSAHVVEQADEVAKEIHRHITLSIRKLDKRLEEEIKLITAEANRRVNEMEIDTRAPAPTADAAAFDGLADAPRA